MPDEGALARPGAQGGRIPSLVRPLGLGVVFEPVADSPASNEPA